MEEIDATPPCRLYIFSIVICLVGSAAFGFAKPPWQKLSLHLHKSEKQQGEWKWEGITPQTLPGWVREHGVARHDGGRTRRPRLRKPLRLLHRLRQDLPLPAVVGSERQQAGRLLVGFLQCDRLDPTPQLLVRLRVRICMRGLQLLLQRSPPSQPSRPFRCPLFLPLFFA